MRNLLLGLLTLFGVVVTAQACDELGITGFVEDSSMLQQAFSLRQSEIDKAEYDRILDKIEDIYTPIFKEKGGVMKIMRLWESEELNARAARNNDDWILKMYGGLARHASFTSDGFALVACHEIGHHIGGAPKKSSFFDKFSWVSNEGQADYWANAKCFRRYVLMDDNVAIVAEMGVDNFVRKQCEESFKEFDENEIAVCIRGAMAGKSLANFFGSQRGVELSFETPDDEVKEKTFHRHPAAQCRMDTYFQGSLCDISYEVEVSQKDYKTGLCSRVDGFELGVRPLCWFKPDSIEETLSLL